MRKSQDYSVLLSNRNDAFHYPGDPLVTGIVLAVMASAAPAFAGGGVIECPSKHNGRRLIEVRLFDGPPSDLADLEPRSGGWDLGDPTSTVLPHYTLQCGYEGLTNTVTVVLPLHMRICEWKVYLRVRCR